MRLRRLFFIGVGAILIVAGLTYTYGISPLQAALAILIGIGLVFYGLLKR